MPFRPSRRAIVAGIGGLVACPTVGRAAYPDKTVTIVHGFPGGNGDFLARIVADGMTRMLGATVVVEAKAGAGGTIASASVARAAPDGYTLMIMVGGMRWQPRSTTSSPSSLLKILR